MLTIAGGIVLGVVFLIVGYFALAFGIIVIGKIFSNLKQDFDSFIDQVKNPKKMTAITLFFVLFAIVITILATAASFTS